MTGKKRIWKNASEKSGGGDESALAYIQTESWKAAFADILDSDALKKYTDSGKAEKMYRSLLEKNIGNGYLLLLDDKPHCIAWWDAARNGDREGTAELICIHSLPDNWRRGYGSSMMNRVLRDMQEAGYSQVILWVFKDNLRVRSFYEANGFRATSHIKVFCGAEEVCYFKILEEKTEE